MAFTPISSTKAPFLKTFRCQFLSAGLPKRLAQHLQQLDFEVRNDVVSVFSHVVRIGAAVDPELMRECARGAFQGLRRPFEVLLGGDS